MPRPGPRPYECVRRAWHSDRHRPMRGSIIQQIFRVVNEAHSSATKKNREWQEKLPIVVFKAEQIMYSKANSEAEYLSQDTLWDRVNDAINTIIRRDESTETGELLPPCVEAALNLGCVPVRASRSQRHSNPRSYLSPKAPEHASTSSRVFDSPNHLNSESTSHVIRNGNTPLSSCSVYPLYYEAQQQTKEPLVAPALHEDKEPNTIFFGTPICASVLEAAEVQPGTKCDLSLRLGILSDPYLGVEDPKGLAHETEHVSRAYKGEELSNNEFCFFPRKLLDKSFQSRKRKSPFGNHMDDGEFCRPKSCW